MADQGAHSESDNRPDVLGDVEDPVLDLCDVYDKENQQRLRQYILLS